MCKLVLSKRFSSFVVTITTKHIHKPTKHLSNRMGKYYKKNRMGKAIEKKLRHRNLIGYSNQYK